MLVATHVVEKVEDGGREAEVVERVGEGRSRCSLQGQRGP
jgi:hypothetical protein